MKKYIPLISVSVLALIVILWFALSDSNEYTAQLAMESDAMSIINYYVPKRIRLREQPIESNIQLPKFRLANTRFGALVIGNGADSLVTIALSESADKGTSFIFIDKNNNEDLTDDGEPVWDDDKGSYWTKEELIDVNYRDGVGKAVPYPVTFYRYKARLDDSIVAFRSGYRKGFITLRDSTYKIGVFDDDLDGLFDQLQKGAIVVDKNGDGVLNGEIDSPEYFLLSASFNLQGFTYVVKEVSPSGDQITLKKSDADHSAAKPLQPGVTAPHFQTVDITGNLIDLGEYRNKVILIDFWATWCSPWEKDLVNLKSNFNRYRSRGFEIVGVNLDYDLDFLKEFLGQNEMTWPQMSTGLGWESPLVELYQISALPKNFLLDRQGVIRYKDLRGENLRTKIYELLNEPEEEN